MQSLYDRIIWTVIALALSLIALNPWLAPGGAGAQGEVVKVDIARVNGRPFPAEKYLEWTLPVRIEQSVELAVRGK